uniref:Uncharacterized protein n=1 Tax=Cucumis melo TaxID=3656 RepID=A0A9I9ELW5_CUCME
MLEPLTVFTRHCNDIVTTKKLLIMFFFSFCFTFPIQMQLSRKFQLMTLHYLRLSSLMKILLFPEYDLW